MRTINQMVIQPNIPNDNRVLWLNGNSASYHNNGTWVTIGESSEDRQELEKKVDNLDKEVGNILSSLGSTLGAVTLEVGNDEGVKTRNLAKLKTVTSNNSFFTNINYGFGTASWNNNTGGVAFIITTGGTAKPYRINADGSVAGGINIDLTNPNTEVFVILGNNEELPTKESEIKGKIYCKKNTSSTAEDNQYNEYIYVKSTKKWEKVGEFQAQPDLSGYAKLSGATFSGPVTFNGKSIIGGTAIELKGSITRGVFGYIHVTPNTVNYSANKTFSTNGMIADIGIEEPFVFTLEDGSTVTKSIRVISTTSQAGA